MRNVLWLILLLLTATLGQISPAPAVASERSVTDTDRDPRLAQRVMLRGEGVPLALVLHRLSEATGVRLGVTGAVGDERLVSFVPKSSLAEVMRSIAELYRLDWTSSGGRQPIYRLGRTLSKTRVEDALRQKCIRKAMDQIAREAAADGTEPTGANTRPQQAQAMREAIRELAGSYLPRVINEGFVSLRVDQLTRTERQRLIPLLQPWLNAVNERERERRPRSAQNLRERGLDPPDYLLEDPGSPPQAQNCKVFIELALRNDVELRAGFSDGAGTTSTFLFCKGDLVATAGVQLYQSRTLRPMLEDQQKAAVPDANDPFERPLRPLAGPRQAPRNWAEKLAWLSEVTGLAIYSDSYICNGDPSDDFRNTMPLPPGPYPSVAKALDQLCGAKERAGPSSFWWRTGNTALVRSCNWLWETQTVLPTALVEGLAGAVRDERSLRPDDLLLLGALKMPQVQSLLGVSGKMDTWRYAIQIPSRLSFGARQLVVTEGLTFAKMTPVDRQVLLQLLTKYRDDAQPQSFSARVRVTGILSTLGPMTYIQLEAMRGEEKLTAFTEFPVPHPSKLGLEVLRLGQEQPAPANAPQTVPGTPGAAAPTGSSPPTMAPCRSN